MQHFGTAAMVLALSLPAFAQPEPIFDLAVTEMTEVSLTVTWSVPAGALSYDLRYSQVDPGVFASFSDWYDAATEVDGEPVPSAPGSLETLTISDSFLRGAYCYVLIKSSDGVAWSDLSNFAYEVLPPPPPEPQPITDLNVERIAPADVTLTWSTPAIHPESTEAAPWCQLAYTTAGPITEANFDALPKKLVGTYDAPGTELLYKLTGLANSTKYWIAVRSCDHDQAIFSAVSANVSPTTLPRDITPPRPIDDLDLIYSGPHFAGFTCTVPHDEGGGYVYRIEIRMSSDGPIDTNEEFDLAVPATYRDMSGGIGDAGTLAGFETTALDPATSYHFCARARDSWGNWSSVSNNQFRPVTPDDVPPARIGDLTNYVHERWATSLRVRWNSVGNDGMRAVATVYDLRYSTSPITEANFAAAPRDMTAPAPFPPYNNPTHHIVEGLVEGTPYYFAIKAGDAADNWGPISNILEVATEDGLAPHSIDDLRVTSIDFEFATLEWTASGDDDTVGRASRYIIKYFNEDPATLPDWWARAWWIDPPPVSGPQGTPERFTTHLAPAAGGSHWFAVKAVDERGNESDISTFARADKPGDSRPPSQIIDLEGIARIDAPKISSITDEAIVRMAILLSWTAPADEDSSVQTYDLRASENDPAEFPSIKEWWDQAGRISWRDPIPDAPPASQAPRPPGSQEGVTDWVGGACIRFYAIQSFDPWGNESLISPPVRVEVVADSLPPDPIVDLAAVKILSTSIALAWKAPSDPPGEDGAAYEYRLRYSAGDPGTFPSQEDWRFQALLAPDLPPPGLPGTIESLIIGGLTPETTYYFTIGSYDRFGNFSGYSYALPVRTNQADAAPPAAIDDLSAELIQSNYVVLTWTATGDDGRSGRAQRCELTQVGHVTIVLPPPPVAGTRESLRIDGLTPGSVYRFTIRAMDDDDKWSEVSGPLTIVTEPPDVVPPAAVTTLRVVDVGDTTVTLAWNAEGEDGAGSARSVQRHDVRFSTENSAAPEAWWNHATPYVGEETPVALPGEEQTLTVRGLAPNQTYYFAVKAADEAPNWGGLSNVASAVTFPMGSVGDGALCSASPGRMGALPGGLVISMLAILAIHFTRRRDA